MSSSDKEQPRKLRSNDSNKVVSNKNLFNFDDVNVYLYQNKPIQIGKPNDESQLYTYFKSDSETPTLKVTPVKQVPRKLPKRRTKADPLPDSKYAIFHRKMKKEETQMLNEEKIKNLVEVDNLNTSLQLLNQYDWIRHLPSITKVNNAMDYQEMEMKRELTISEIEKLLEKQVLWKKKRDKFNHDTRLFHNGERIVVKEDAQEEQIPRSPKLDLRQNTPSPFTIDRKIKLDTISSSEHIDLQRTPDKLFGVDLHDIEVPKHGYQLPLGWRRAMGNQN